MMDNYPSATLQRLLAACEKSKGASHELGAALEDLVEYVFSIVPSVSLYARDVKDESGAQEVDLVFSHLHPLSGIPIPDVTIIVECKNEAAKLSAAHVREFGNKLRTRSMGIGVLVSRTGLSGRPGRHGHSAIRDELQGGVAIIVVTAYELAGLCDSTGLSALLTRRLNELRTFRGYRSI
jgi:hypothetical protein